jgi:hypothetical protein
MMAAGRANVKEAKPKVKARSRIAEVKAKGRRGWRTGRFYFFNFHFFNLISEF